MIDPIFAERASPMKMLGPKRIRPPACTTEDLPKIHAVFISHDHYDHFDQAALKRIHNLHQPVFMCGLGSGDILPKDSNMLLMDWMDSHTIDLNGKEYKITFVPTCHWANRSLRDFNTRLWGGVIIDTPYNHRIYYSGDTGYCPVFKEIGRMFGPFDLTVLPIGAYEPRIILSPQHVDPE